MNAKDKLEGSLLFIRFSVSAWSAKVKDKALQRENEERKEAEANTVRVWRHLCSPEIKPIHSLRDSLRNRIYASSDTLGTLAGMEGEIWRVMPSLTFDRQKPTLKADIRKWESLVVGLCDDFTWQMAIERDMKRQGQMANRKNYPSLDILRDTFSMDFKVRPFTVSETMLGDLFDDSQIDIAAQAEKQAELIAENMLKSNIERIRKPLLQLIKGMENHGKGNSYFKDVTINQIDDLISTMYEFNVTGNQDIGKIIASIKSDLLGLDPKSLRNDDGMRREVAETTQNIIEKMETYF